MRSEDSYSNRRAARAGDLSQWSCSPAREGAAVTSRGTKYWNSGAIPLIAPEILGNIIIAEVADLAIVISAMTGMVSSRCWSNPEQRELFRQTGKP